MFNEDADLGEAVGAYNEAPGEEALEVLREAFQVSAEIGVASARQLWRAMGRNPADLEELDEVVMAGLDGVLMRLLQ